MSEGSKHVPDNVNWEHVSVPDGTEDGGCLFHWNSERNPSKPTSCHYGWQAKKETRSKIKNIYKNYPIHSERSALAQRGLSNPWLKQGGAAAQAYGERLALPRERGEWDLDGPGRPVRKRKQYILPGRNFTHWMWPYWNNAHHLIPKGTFAKAMLGVEPEDIRDLVIAGLFRAPYNINHMKNMLFLPMDREVGMLLRLPRHLTRDEGSEVDDPVPFFNHHQYNVLIKQALEGAVKDYVKTARKARGGDEECKAIETIKLSREKLEELSEDCVDVIVDWGSRHAGAPLVDMDLGG